MLKRCCFFPYLFSCHPLQSHLLVLSTFGQKSSLALSLNIPTRHLFFHSKKKRRRGTPEFICQFLFRQNLLRQPEAFGCIADESTFAGGIQETGRKGQFRVLGEGESFANSVQTMNDWLTRFSNWRGNWICRFCFFVAAPGPPPVGQKKKKKKKKKNRRPCACPPGLRRGIFGPGVYESFKRYPRSCRVRKNWRMIQRQGGPRPSGRDATIDSLETHTRGLALRRKLELSNLFAGCHRTPNRRGWTSAGTPPSRGQIKPKAAGSGGAI